MLNPMLNVYALDFKLKQLFIQSIFTNILMFGIELWHCT